MSQFAVGGWLGQVRLGYELIEQRTHRTTNLYGKLAYAKLANGELFRMENWLW